MGRKFLRKEGGRKLLGKDEGRKLLGKRKGLEGWRIEMQLVGQGWIPSTLSGAQSKLVPFLLVGGAPKTKP